MDESYSLTNSIGEMGREERKDTEHVPYRFLETPILVEPYIEEGDKVIDWEHRRYEIAKDITAAICTRPNVTALC